MFKQSFVFTFAILLSAISTTRAQSPKVMQSPVLASARSCMNQLATDARAAGLEVATPQSAGRVTILHPIRDPLVPMMASITKCLDTAFATKEVRQRKDNKQAATAWFSKIDNEYVYCFRPGNAKEDISPLGGQGPQRSWHVVLFRCGVGKEIVLEWTI